MSSTPLLLATFYRTVYGVVASYITARLAPYRPSARTRLAGGFIGLVVRIVGAVGDLDAGPAFAPNWYPSGADRAGDAVGLGRWPTPLHAVAGTR